MFNGVSVAFSRTTEMYAIPENTADITPTIIHDQEILEARLEISSLDSPIMKTPISAMRMQIHCAILIRSFKNMEAKSMVNIGAKYCRVEAMAIGR